MMKLISYFSFVVLAVFIISGFFGFKGEGKLNEYSAIKIESEDMEVARYNLVEKVIESLNAKNGKDNSYFIKAVDAAIDKNDTKFLINIFDKFSENKYYIDQFDYGYKDDIGRPRLKEMMNLMLSDIESFSENGKGSAELLNYIGKRMVVYGDYYESYYFLSSAALAKTDRQAVYASNLRGLLHHFGCIQDYSKWGDVTSSKNFKQLLDPYPELPFDDGFDIGRARRDVAIHENVPDLQETCPINLYKYEKE